MSGNFFQSALLRELYWAGRRVGARFAGGSGPRVFLNSIPKAGTHLATVELERLGIRSCGIHVKTRKVNVEARNDEPKLEFRPDLDALDRYARKVRPGQYMTGHLPWDPALLEYLDKNEFRTIMMIRDPRAILVSEHHYIVGLRRHYLHSVLTSLPDDQSRFRMLMYGNELPFVRGFRDKLERYYPWANHPGVHTISFENLVGERGGGTSHAKIETLKGIADFLGIALDGLPELADTSTRSTATFRKGRIDGWRDELHSCIHEELDSELGDLYARLGYDRR